MDFLDFSRPVSHKVLLSFLHVYITENLRAASDCIRNCAPDFQAQVS